MWRSQKGNELSSGDHQRSNPNLLELAKCFKDSLRRSNRDAEYYRYGSTSLRVEPECAQVLANLFNLE
jgi:hypothetical protein